MRASCIVRGARGAAQVCGVTTFQGRKSLVTDDRSSLNRRKTERLAMSERRNSVTTLSEEQCWQLLENQPIGRFVAALADSVEIFPVNYMVKSRAIYFASAPGTKMVALTANPSVAFEIDGGDRGSMWEHGSLWSVIVHGTAERLASDDDIETSGILELSTWHPSEKRNFVRIVPRSVTGRTFLRPAGLRPSTRWPTDNTSSELTGSS